MNNRSYFRPDLPETELNAVGVLGLAHVGDAVYEILVRTKLCIENPSKVSQLHLLSVSMVNATAQAKAAHKILPFLTQEETAVFKRGKNAKVNSIPHNSSVSEYHFATGLEALFGWLYLKGKPERVLELFNYGLVELKDGD